MAHRVKYRWLSQDGYIHLQLDDGSLIAEHRWVWQCAFGEIPPGHQIHHRDGDRANNKLSNLEALLPGAHKRAHEGHWLGEDGRWWKRCRTCGTASPEDDFPTKCYRNGVRLTRGNCKACERNRQRAKNGWKGGTTAKLGRHYGPSSAGTTS